MEKVKQCVGGKDIWEIYPIPAQICCESKKRKNTVVKNPQNERVLHSICKYQEWVRRV